jgi:hypothetical protein
MPASQHPERVAEIRDTLAYLLVYAPNLPPEDETSLSQEIEGVLRKIRLLWNEVQDVERRHWLDLLAAELLEAQRHFRVGDDAAGCSAIQSAEERLQAWATKKHSTPTFIAGPGGDVRKA